MQMECLLFHLVTGRVKPKIPPVKFFKFYFVILHKIHVIRGIYTVETVSRDHTRETGKKFTYDRVSCNTVPPMTTFNVNLCHKIFTTALHIHVHVHVIHVLTSKKLKLNTT
ncbi:hypothetical protein ACF0H5_016205 [Mactra antiquata]